MPRALIVGGTGAIGAAVASRLLAAGWRVDLTGRDPSHLPPELAAAGAGFAAIDRDDQAALRALFGAGADLLVDCACYTAAQATAVLPLLGSVTSAVMLSSKAVYVDAAGRHSNSDVPPCFDGPIGEDQPTLRPNAAHYASREGYGANKVAAEEVLLDSGYPVSILRASKVHGPWSRRPREWVFVKRILDKRPVVLLAHRGAGVDHPSAASNVAALVEHVAAHPGRRVLNSADPDAPSSLAIARIVAAHLGHSWNEVLLDDTVPDQDLGRTPWDAVPPIVLDTSAAIALGYRPAGDYAATVAAELDWLVATTREPGAGWAVPADADPFFAPLLNYVAEDRFLADRAAR
jgi:nucleoside-diphosphate-sugar epimerase